MPNYMLDAMRGYSFVDNIYRQKRQDKLELEDREFQKGRIAKDDARQEKQDALQEKNNAWTDKQRGWQEKQYNDQLALRDINAAEIEQIFGQELAANPQAAKKASGLLQDPVRTGKIIAAHEELSKYLAAGKTPPNELTTELVNLIGAEELSGRGGDDGLTRTVESVVPSNKPGEVMVGFNVTGKDGKTYPAPMTTGASADPADNQVQSIPVKKLIEWGNGGAASAKTIALARAKLGDNSFLEAYRAANAEIAKRQNELTDYEAKKKVDVRYRENKPVAAGKYGMYDPATGKFISNPATQGLDGGEWVTDAEGNEHLVGGSGKGGKPQAAKINWNDDGTADVYDPNTRKVTRVRSEEVAEQQSAQMAEEWAHEQARGVLNPRPKDELIQAKRTEFYNQLMDGQQGKSAPAAVGNSPPATAASLLDKFVGPPKGTPDGKKYGKRADGTEKGSGFLGELKRPDGGVSTEISIGVTIDGKNVEIPSIVPGLSKSQIDVLLNLGENEKPPKDVVDIAAAHAKKRISEGKSPFAQDGEQEAIQKPSAKKTRFQEKMREFNVPESAPINQALAWGKGVEDNPNTSKVEVPGQEFRDKIKKDGQELKDNLQKKILPAINKKIADSASEGVDFWTKSLKSVAGSLSENVLRGAAETLDSAIRSSMAGGKTYKDAADETMLALMTGDVDHFQFQFPADNGQARKPILGQGHTTAADVMKRGIKAASQVQVPGDRGYTRYPIHDQGYTTMGEGLVNFLQEAAQQKDFSKESKHSRYYKPNTNNHPQSGR